MAGNQEEINRLTAELNQMTQEMRKLEQNYEEETRREIERIRNEFSLSMAAQQTDLKERYIKLEASVSQAYLSEVEAMRSQYQQKQAEFEMQKEAVLRQLHELETAQSSFLQQQATSDQKMEKIARERIERLTHSVSDGEMKSCPVEHFYPHALEMYLEAGDEAKRLLDEGLYSLAASKADVVYMAVEKLKLDTQAKLVDMERMFAIYREKLNIIWSSFHDDNTWTLRDKGGEVLLRLTNEDADYWSDLLYNQIQETLEYHQKNVDEGVDGWLRKNHDREVSLDLALDREIQKLDAIPQRLRTCVSYALSACDCFNHSQEVLEAVQQLMEGQNFICVECAYGACKAGNDQTAGYRHYAEVFLDHEACLQPGCRADYREERCFRFRKSSGDECCITIVPRRNRDAVSLEIYMSLRSEYLPDILQERLRQILCREECLHGIPLQIVREPVATADDRPMSLEAMNQIFDEARERELTAKYSIGVNG